jgi:hypothetical protein
MIELPLDQATQDVIARYKRGTDMLASAAVALRRLRERVEAGEADGMDWPEYRATYLEPHIKRRWIEQQLSLAPPKATEAEVARNVDQYRAQNRERVRAHRRRQNAEVESALRNAPVEMGRSGEMFLDFADSPRARHTNHPVEELIAEFNALSRQNQDEFLRRIGAVRSGLKAVA